MPLKQCKKDGKSGWKYGDSGKCYTGPGAKKKAIKQGLAEGDGKLEASQAEMDEAINELLLEGPEGESFDGEALQAVYAYISQKQRDALPDSDFAWPEARKYPIKDQAHLDSAVKLLGRAPKEKQDAIKKRIIEIAHRKGLKLPESWKS